MATNIDDDLNFLPLIHEILKSIEKDSHDISPKVTELRNKLQRAREHIEKLPGTEYSRDEQLARIEVLRQQLISKNQLLAQYKNAHNFDTSL